MQNIPDKDLDQLFKDSNTDHNISYEESSWLKLEAKLESGRKKKLTKNLVALLIVLLAIGSQFSGVVFNLYNYYDKMAENILDTEAASVTDRTNTGKNPYIGKNSVNTVNREGLTEMKNSHLMQTFELKQEKSPAIIRISKRKSYEQKENETIEKEQDVAILKEKIFYNSAEIKNSFSVLQNRDEGNGVREVKEENGRIVLNPEGFGISGSDSIVFPILEIIGNKNDNDVLSNQNEKNVSTLYEKPADINAIYSDTSEVAEPREEAQVPVKADSVFTSSSKINKDHMIKFRKFSAGVLVSPDFSSIGFFKFGKPGTDIGVFAEYHLTSRWTLFTGLIRTSKIYSSEGGYHASNGYWAYKDKADRIDGSCKVLDIPLNIKYHFIQNRRNLVFISTGLSSYLMYDERYTFVYINTNAERSWDSNVKRNYYFSVVNFSFGYERYLSKAFSIQAEPFIKVPMKNIGIGKTTLMTAGVFFYLKYNIGY